MIFFLAYKDIPFYISSKGYGVFIDSSDLISFEVQSERMDKVKIKTRSRFPTRRKKWFNIYRFKYPSQANKSVL